MAKNTGKNTAHLKPAWSKGETGNPNGRPKGRKNFATVYREALEHLARLNHTTADALEVEMYANALAKARKGEYSFYRDTVDRLYGRAQENVNMQVEYPQPLLGGLTNDQSNHSNTETAETKQED